MIEVQVGIRTKIITPLFIVPDRMIFIQEAEIEERNMVDYSECEDEYRTERAEAQEEYYRH